MNSLANDSSGFMAAFFAVYGVIMVISLLLAVFGVICMWKIYAKAGQPGWAAIIPVYNLIVLCEIINRPKWWVAIVYGGLLLAFLIVPPIATLVFGIIMTIDLGKAFSKSTGWSVGMLLFLSYIGMAILAFGKDEYQPITR